MIVAVALAAAIAYGAADFLGGLASRRAETFAVVVWSQAAGLACLLAALPFVGSHARPADAAWGAACGLAGAAAIVWLYRGLAIGVMSVVSPVTAVLAALIPVVFSLLTGARLSPLALVGIAGALVAVVLISASVSGGGGAQAPRVAGLPPGVLEAIGAGCAFGFFFIALARTDRAAGLIPLVAARVVSIAAIGAVAVAARHTLRVARPARTIVAGAGVLDMTANVLYVIAAQRGELAIVAVLTSLYPASTVALAAIVVRERLGSAQWIGVALALGSVAALAR